MAAGTEGCDRPVQTTIAAVPSSVYTARQQFRGGTRMLDSFYSHLQAQFLRPRCA